MTDKPRRIGMGMKPRGEEEKLPTTEGQEVPASEGVKEASSVTVEGGGLAGVVTGISAAENEKESIVALDEVFEAPPAVPQEAFDALAAAMKASEMASGAEAFQNLDPAYDDSELDALAEKMLPEMMEGLGVRPSEEFDLPWSPPQMGQLDNGEYRHTVRIAESYVEGAKQQAAADNMSLEDWLSLQLNTYLEQYWWANGPK